MAHRDAFQQLWTESVQPSVTRILQGERLDRGTYEKTHAAIYSHATREVRIPRERETHSGAYQLYKALDRFYEEWTAKELRHLTESNNDDALLKAYSAKWKTFSESLSTLNRLMRYVNRSYMKRYGHRELHAYEQDQKALLAWKRALLGGKESRVVAAAHRLIQRCRRGDIVDENLAKAVLQTLVAFGFEKLQRIDESDLEDGELVKHRRRFYAKHFEEPLVQKTLEFYREISAAFLEGNNTRKFIKLAHKLLQREEDLCLKFVPTSKGRVLRAAEEALIIENLSAIRSEFLTLLHREKIPDAKNLFEFCARTPEAVNVIAKDFENHVREEGLQAVEAVRGAAEPSAFIFVVLDVYNRYESVVSEAFSHNTILADALHVACVNFVNNNTYRSPRKCAEIVVRHIDRFQRKGCANDDLVARTMVVFKFLSEKDVFEKLYTRFLAARLVGAFQPNDDAENLMIAKLQEACGHSFTTKMVRMCKDVLVSRDLTAEFRESQKENRNCDFAVSVLSSGTWTFSAIHTFAIPKQLTECVESFTEFYSNRHESRKLTWVMGRSRGEIVTNGLNRNYTLSATAFQMAILLQFSERDALNEGILCGNLDVTSEVLRVTMDSIVKTGILMKDNDAFVVNPKFSSKKLKIDLVRLQTTKIVESKKEEAQLEDSIEQSRQMEIQAAIVRILKTRRRIAHNQLLTEVIDQVTARFAPKIPVIKKCIDLMIEKEYLRRAEGAKDLYEYIA